MDPTFTRRDLLRIGATSAGVAAIAPLLEACAGPAAQATPNPTASAKPTLAPATLTVQVGVQNVEFAGILAAEDQGYLKSLALTESLLPFGPNVQPVTVVAGGSAQAAVIVGGNTFLQAPDSGSRVVATGTMYQTAPSGLLSL